MPIHLSTCKACGRTCRRTSNLRLHEKRCPLLERIIFHMRERRASIEPLDESTIETIYADTEVAEDWITQRLDDDDETEGDGQATLKSHDDYPREIDALGLFEDLCEFTPANAKRSAHALPNQGVCGLSSSSRQAGKGTGTSKGHMEDGRGSGRTTWASDWNPF